MRKLNVPARQKTRGAPALKKWCRQNNGVHSTRYVIYLLFITSSRSSLFSTQDVLRSRETGVFVWSIAEASFCPSQCSRRGFSKTSLMHSDRLSLVSLCVVTTRLKRRNRTACACAKIHRALTRFSFYIHSSSRSRSRAPLYQFALIAFP